jgi:co-chaperonin GroES (HSP10)
LNDYVIVSPTSPDAESGPLREGIIEAVARGTSVEVFRGERVMYRAAAGHPVTVDGRAMQLVPLADLVAKHVDADTID